MPEYFPGYYLPDDYRPVRLTAEDVQRLGAAATTAPGNGALTAPDPCCAHQAQLDAAIRDLARAHGRPVGAERVARGLPPMTTKARYEHVAGLPTAQEDT